MCSASVSISVRKTRLPPRELRCKLLLPVIGWSTFPNEEGPAWFQESRELTAMWPYVVVYRIEPEAVVILRVWHGAQDR